MFLAGKLEIGETSIPVRIRNLSSRGALIDGAALPSVGTKLRLLRGDLAAKGQVTWQANEQAGIEFDGSIDVGTWLARVGHRGQERVDSVVAALRHSEPVTDDRKRTRRQSLRQISKTLDQVCGRLAATSNLTVELAEELVKLDVIAQDLRVLATGRKS